MKKSKLFALITSVIFSLLVTIGYAEEVSNTKEVIEPVSKTQSYWEKTKELSSKALNKTKETWKNTEDSRTKAWDKTKEVSSKALDKTKEVSKPAWDKTKELSSKALDKTKEMTKSAWKKTKEVGDKLIEGESENQSTTIPEQNKI